MAKRCHSISSRVPVAKRSVATAISMRHRFRLGRRFAQPDPPPTAKLAGQQPPHFYKASLPVSPVRMRTVSASVVTKILPSPI
jgi:hypothetical protein